ncbi:MAG: divalent metal cation transporter [Patescibacteria group bacterium]
MPKTKSILKKTIEAPAIILEKTVELSELVVHDIASKKPMQEARGFWRTLGPGLTTGASDDDPAGIATYSQTGAQYGPQLLWLAGFTFPFMAVVQEMCARIGIVTGKGLAANIRTHYPRTVLYICTILLFAANTFNLGADLGAMAESMKLLFPGANFAALIIIFALVSLFLQIFSTYARYAKYLKYLALTLVAYIISTIMIKGLDWQAITFHTLTPSIAFSQDQIILICAILGTTISPYLFFWQTSQEVEEQVLEGKTTIRERRGASVEDIKKMRIDVWSGMFLSNLIMFFIIVASAGTLYANGIHDIATAAQAAEALRPFAGDASYLLFTLGIVSTGLLAVPVLAGSASYAVAETFRWKNGLYNKLHNAHAFYGILIISMAIGFLLNFIGINPMKALIYSAVANGLVAPLVLVLIVSMSSNRKIMGKWVSGPITKFCGWFVTILMALAGVATIASLFL